MSLNLEDFAKYHRATFTFTSGTLLSGTTTQKTFRYLDELKGLMNEWAGNGWIDLGMAGADVSTGARFVLKEKLVQVSTTLVDPV